MNSNPKHASNQPDQKPGQRLLSCEGQQRSEYLNNLCGGIDQIHTIIANLLRERDRLFRETCRIAAEMGGFKLVWVGIIDPDTLWLRPVAKAGELQSYVDQVAVSVDPNLPEGKGLSGEAVRRGHYVISNDFLADDRVTRWHDIAERIGLRSAGVFPIFQGKQPVGVIKFYGDQVDFFYQELIDLLEVMVRHISYAMEKLEYKKIKQPAG